MSNSPVFIRCCDGCGASVPADKVNDGGWVRLEITGRYRCIACVRALDAINKPQPEERKTE